MTDDPNADPGHYRQWRDLPDTGLIMPDVQALKPEPGANFPYGVAVEPDR